MMKLSMNAWGHILGKLSTAGCPHVLTPTGDLIVNTGGREMAVSCPSVSFVPYLRLALPPPTPIRALGGNSRFTLTPIL